MAYRRGDNLEQEHPGALERILFARVELWAVLALLLLGCLFVIGFGAAVLDAEREDFRLGSVSRAALTVAEIPQTIKRFLAQNGDMRVSDGDRFSKKPTGWSFPSGPMTGLNGYILLSRYDGTNKRQTIELVSLPNMRIVHAWTPVATELLKSVTHVSRFAEHTNWTDSRFREVHPWLEDNGDLIVKDFNSPLFRIDACGKRVWTLQDVPFHHSIEADSEGNLWIPSLSERPTVPHVTDAFWEDMITKVSPTGKPLFSRSVPQILIRHGYANWLFSNGMYNRDPAHTNDIQPVITDGPFWKRGDLFVSMRNISAIMLYRPSTDQILWIKRGPWISQHDVDVIDDHRIGIFDNAVEERSRLKPFFPSSSQLVLYDFSTSKVSLPLRDAMQKNGIRSWVEGLFTQLPDGSTMIEDSDDGRLIIFRPDGSIAAEYINRSKDGSVYKLGWSRYIDKSHGDAIARNLQKVKCDAGA